MNWSLFAANPLKRVEKREMRGFDDKKFSRYSRNLLFKITFPLAANRIYPKGLIISVLKPDDVERKRFFFLFMFLFLNIYNCVNASF